MIAATPNVQLGLDLRLSAARPLVPLEACVVLLDQDADALLNLIHRGALRWAWDIRSSQATRREIRVHRDCLLSYPLPQREWSRAEKPREHWNLLLNSFGIVSGAEALTPLPVPQVARRLGCESQHVRNLIEEKCLRTAANGKVNAASLIAWLVERRAL